MSEFSLTLDDLRAYMAVAGTRPHQGQWWPMFTPQQELLGRLNDRLKGRDPGKPWHWKGL